jgi:uncharacterized protein YgiM (DUF1202 family)
MSPQYTHPAHRLIILAWLLCAAPCSADTEYVRVASSPVRAGQSSLDAVNGWVHAGESVAVISRAGGYARVKTDNGIEGWIAAAKLSTTKPPDESDAGLLGSASRLLGPRASATTSTAGARGLDKAAEGYAATEQIPQAVRDAVDHMTLYRLDDETLERFMQEGGLGEYAH